MEINNTSYSTYNTRAIKALLTTAVLDNPKGNNCGYRTNERRTFKDS